MWREKLAQRGQAPQEASVVILIAVKRNRLKLNSTSSESIKPTGTRVLRAKNSTERKQKKQPRQATFTIRSWMVFFSAQFFTLPDSELLCMVELHHLISIISCTMKPYFFSLGPVFGEIHLVWREQNKKRPCSSEEAKRMQH